MACERHYDPAIQGFSEPDWQKLDFKKYYALYENAYAYGLKRQGVKPTQEELDGFRGMAAWSHAELYLAHLDLDGDGKLASVLAIRSFSCGERPKPGMATTDLFLLNEAGTDVDYVRQDSWGGWGSNSTIELFDGKPYIEHYESDDDRGLNFTLKGFFTVLKGNPAALVVKARKEFEKEHPDCKGPQADRPYGEEELACEKGPSVGPLSQMLLIEFTPPKN